MQTKSFWAPVWIMTGVFLFSSFIAIGTWMYLRSSLGESIHLDGRSPISFLIWPLVLAAETILYVFIRKKIVVKKWAWVHVLFCLLGFVLLRILVIGATLVIPQVSSAENLREAFRMIFLLDKAVFWASIILGHVALVATLIKAFSKKHDPLPEVSPFTIFDE